MSERRIQTAQTEELEPEQLGELTALCEAAFMKPFAAEFARSGPGLHVTAEIGGRIVAHAMVVDRRVYVGHETDLALDVGYVEHVATHPAHQGRGHGAAVVGTLGDIIREQYALGALATRDSGFYEPLGWRIWLGQTWVRTADGQRVRTPASDGEVMILRTARTPRDLPLDGPIAVEWRPEEPW